MADDPAEGRREVIRSADNKTLRYVRSLRRRALREAERAFVVEGARGVADALAAGGRVRMLLLRDGDAAVARFADEAEAPVRHVESRLFDGLAETVTPQGVIAVFDLPDLPVPDQEPVLALVLDQIRDPGNLGTLLRAAAAAGASLVALTPGTVDPTNPKAVRAAVGAHFRLPIRWLDARLLEWLVERCPLRVAAEASAGAAYDEVDWTGGAALLIGSEAWGLSAELTSLATTRVAIPLTAGVESLNAAVAGSVILFEAARQRRRAMHPPALPKT